MENSDGKKVVRALWEENTEQTNLMWEDPGADRTRNSQDQCAWHTGIMVGEWSGGCESVECFNICWGLQIHFQGTMELSFVFKGRGTTSSVDRGDCNVRGLEGHR